MNVLRNRLSVITVMLSAIVLNATGVRGEYLIISQENANNSFNCCLGLCSVAETIVPQETFEATKVGFKFGGTGGGTVMISIRNSLGGTILAKTSQLNILQDGSFTEGTLNSPITLYAGSTYYLQIDALAPCTIRFYFSYGNPYPSGIAYCKVSYGWVSNNPPGGDYTFRIYGVSEPSAPPVADADGPYTIFVGDTLTLDARGSTDADNDIVSYIWDLDDNGSFETDAGSQAIFDVNYTYLQSLGLLVNHTYNIHVQVTDSEGQSDVNGSTLTILPKPAVKVAVDIKPGGCPNPVNVKSSGVLPVAILGTTDYDVTTIDPTSIRLAGVEPLRSGYEDVATPVSDNNDCNCIAEGPDGFLDLTLKFETQKIVEAVGEVNDGDVLTLALTGVLFDPIPFERPIKGADCILIRGRHKPINPTDINKDGVVNAVDFAIMAENWLQSSVVED